MTGKLGCWTLAALAALALGVAGADGRSLATTTLLVEVIGGGPVTSDGGQITCGAGSKTCYFSTSAPTGTVILTAANQGIWTFGSWADCPTPAGNKCTVSFDGIDHEVTSAAIG